MIDPIFSDLKVVIGEIKDFINNELQNNKEDVCLGFAIPGVVDFKNTLVKTESSFKNIDIDFKKYFSDIPAIKQIILLNDGKAALLGEKYYGNLSDVENGFVITIGTAIGGAALLNNKLLRGSHNFAGEYSKQFAYVTGDDKDDEISIYCGLLQACYRFAFAKNISPSTIDKTKLIDAYIANDTDAVKIIEE
ncbi:hypothetical protein Zmor_012217 [Zophobas morio]|uniref:ROK family protein n=1 Tax=Zophobas morio TaxID=2755281 RepID=A0AA38HI53_9CUCU|nr:hypothetical protein Zmor_012217 [Zophobas morio]